MCSYQQSAIWMDELISCDFLILHKRSDASGWTWPLQLENPPKSEKTGELNIVPAQVYTPQVWPQTGLAEPVLLPVITAGLWLGNAGIRET